MLEIKTIGIGLPSITNKDKVIYHCIFDTQEEMNHTFIRFTEFIESPTLKGTIFEKSDVEDTYPGYYEEVLGHNVPGNSYLKFLDVYKDCLSTEEIEISNRIPENRAKSEGDFYIIGTFKTTTNIDVLPHEISHAIFYLIPLYRTMVFGNLNFAKTVSGDDFFKNMEDILELKMYDKSVWADETHAYLIDLALGNKGFFYGYNFSGFISQLLAGKVRLHFKYIDTAKSMLRTFKYFYKRALIK